MAKSRKKPAPVVAAPQWVAVWYRANDKRPFGADGSERPCLMRPHEDENSILLLMRDEVQGIKTLVIPLADADYIRPMITLNGHEASADAAMTSYRAYARVRGATSDAAREMGIDLPTPSSRAPEGPEKTNLTELYWRAMKLCEMTEEELRAKYAHMNPGMQAMQLRGLLKRKGWNA